MELALQVLAGLLCIPMLALGLGSMFKPAKMLEGFALQVEGTVGLNTVRGIMGGFFVGMAAMIIRGLMTGDSTWFVAVAYAVTIAFIGRIIGAMTDGYHKALLRPLAIEVIIVAVMLAAHYTMGAA